MRRTSWRRRTKTKSSTFEFASSVDFRLYYAPWCLIVCIYIKKKLELNKLLMSHVCRNLRFKLKKKNHLFIYHSVTFFRHVYHPTLPLSLSSFNLFLCLIYK